MNKSILITGCSTGIGFKAAEMLQARGYNVIASVRKLDDVDKLREIGFKHVLHLDLRDSSSIAKAVNDTLELCDGKIFALFNNGAYGLPGAVEDLSRGALARLFETNVFGTHELTAKLLPYMLQQPDARIVQNSSVLGFAAMAMRGAYNASKFALEGLSDTLRLELRDTPVHVSIIQPGPILTNFRRNALIALEEEIDIAASRHKDKYQAALKRLKKEGPAIPFTLPPEAVVKKLIHALEAKKPKTRYYVTFPTYLIAYLQRCLPTSLMDKVLMATSKA